MELRFHRDLSRRRLLRVGALAFSGLNLPSLLRAAGARRDVSCIVLFQDGGCCQLSSWDPKPEAPPEIRGSFKPIPTALPGIHFTELVPRMAGIANKFTLIRSMTSDVAIHDVGRKYMMSGTKPRNELQHPSFGSVVSRELGPRNGLPPYVVIPDRKDAGEAGFLGSAYDQFVAGDPKAKDYRVKDVGLPDGTTLEEALSNKKLLEAVDREFEATAKSPLMGAMDEFYQKAFDLVASPDTRKAFDIHQEPEKLRDRYGRGTVGQGALLSRRLVEAGVRLSSVYHGGYDTHTSHEPGYAKLLPDFDQAFTALVEDLEERGMLATTLVLGIGEFGRTPKLNPQGGRDHWPGVFSVVMAGAGVPRGLVIGKSDANASAPIERPVRIEDLAATVYRILGIDAHKPLPGPNRPVLINKDGVPIQEVLG